MIERKADGIPVYEVKNEGTGKKKVLHRARLLLWLADYGEPVRYNRILISDTLPGMVPGQQLDDSGDGLHPVPGESLQYGFDLTHFRAVIDNPEPMTSRIRCEVRRAYLDKRRVKGFRLILRKSQTRTVWAPTRETSQLAELPEDQVLPSQFAWFHPKLGGK